MANRVCVVRDCQRNWYCREWCQYHYNKWHTFGDPLGKAAKKEKLVCSVSTCNAPQKAKQVCARHYQRIKLYGNPRADIPFKRVIRGSITKSFWARVDKTPNCWVWLGSKTLRGYGRFSYGGKNFSAHRFAYELVFGEIPRGLQLDHLCRNTSCVNPTHLEAVTAVENVRRARKLVE